MRSDDELRKLMEHTPGLYPVATFAKRFLEIFGDCTGEDFHRLAELELIEADRAYARLEALLKERR